MIAECVIINQYNQSTDWSLNSAKMFHTLVNLFEQSSLLRQRPYTLAH